jgi:calcineurin-like phosphoesterase family protein
MEANWHKIYSSTFEHKVELVKAVLDNWEIESVVVNKKDSVYHFGEIELYVQGENVIKAKQIINKEKL